MVTLVKVDWLRMIATEIRDMSDGFNILSSQLTGSAAVDTVNYLQYLVTELSVD